MDLKVYKVLVSFLIIFSCNSKSQDKIERNKSELSELNENGNFSFETDDTEGHKKFIVKTSSELEKSEMTIEVFNNNSIQSKIYDLIENCPVDHFVKFNSDSFEVTDLDNDGVKEFSFIYTLACKGDISNSQMKLILIEGGEKYKIRGSNLCLTNNMNDIIEYNAGIADIDVNFKNKKFLNYAIKKWNEFLWEGSGQNSILLNYAREKNSELVNANINKQSFDYSDYYGNYKLSFSNERKNSTPMYWEYSIKISKDSCLYYLSGFQVENKYSCTLEKKDDTLLLYSYKDLLFNENQEKKLLFKIIRKKNDFYTTEDFKLEEAEEKSKNGLFKLSKN